MGGPGSGRRVGTIVRTHESATQLFAKRCSECEVEKPLCDFAPHGAGKYRTKARCRACEAALHQKWKSENRERYLEWKRGNHDKRLHYRLKAAYGLTLDDFNTLLAKQGGTCALCLKPETTRNRRGGVRRLSVDHDHATGRVRGLLCFRCNVAVAQFEADGSLDRLKAYLWPGVAE